MNIIVLGDIMLDINHFSKIERNAPESDNVPIYNVYETTFHLGGAANVSHNLYNINANVELISIIGDDYYGKKMIDILDKKKIPNKLWIDNTRTTTQKNRIFYNNILKTRYDIENTHEISSLLEEEIFNYIKSKKTAAIILSDYNKGCATKTLMKNIIKYANENNIYTFVDPKNDYLKYQSCFCFKPNLKEAIGISKTDDLIETIDFLKENIKYVNLVLTCGKDGIILNNIENKINHKKYIEVVDVTGSGDIVLAVLVYHFLLTKDIQFACNISNYIAGISVKSIGNYIVSKEDLDHYLLFTSKIINGTEIEKISRLSRLNETIVFTNGCFDILHSAHIELLQYSKKQGDLLIVGLNSDDSIRRLKGITRPINNIIERSTILSLFDFVDYIIIFNEDTPFHILQHLKPDIIIKGSDYTKENIIGKEFCKEVKLFSYIKDKSTSLIIEQIKNNYL